MLLTNQSRKQQLHKEYAVTLTIPLRQAIDIPCKHNIRYIIVETHYDAPEDHPFRGAMLEICELEVYGKLYFAR